MDEIDKKLRAMELEYMAHDISDTSRDEEFIAAMVRGFESLADDIIATPEQRRLMAIDMLNMRRSRNTRKESNQNEKHSTDAAGMV